MASEVSFSRNIEKWFNMHNITLLCTNGTEIVVINIKDRKPLINSVNINKCNKIIGNKDIVIKNSDNIIIYQGSEYNILGKELFVPRFKFTDVEITENSTIKYVADKIGVINNNQLTIFNKINKFNTISFKNKLIDITRNFAIIQEKNKNYILNINSRKKILTNYNNPSFIEEYNNKLYIIDKNLGALLCTDYSNLECTKLNIIPSNVIQLQLFENSLLITTNKKVDKNSVLYKILEKNNVKPKNAIYIFDLITNSIRYNINFGKKEINSSFCINKNIHLLGENDDILNEVVLFD